jgi:type VI secretion system protein ImpC
VAARVGATCVAAGSPALLAQEAFVALPDAKELAARLTAPQFDAWRSFRLRREAGAQALVLPRVLSRLPYGAATDAVETWAFEEDPPPRRHEALLWESGVFAVGAMIARAFADAGWDLDLATEVRELDDVPVYVHGEAGERTLVPSAEVWLTDEHVAALEAHGVTPLVTHRRTGMIAMRALRAVADPPMPLRPGRS